MKWLRDLRDRFRGMRGRLLLLVFVVLLPMLLVQVGIYLAWYDSQRDGEDADNLEMAGAVAVAFSTLVDDLRRQEMAIGQALLAAAPFDVERANAILAANAREYPSVQAFHWVSPDGTVIASSVPAGVGLHIEDRAYFRQIVEGGAEWVLSDLLRSRATEAPAFFVARAIRDADAADLAGILIAEVAPDRLDRLAMDVQRRGQGAVAVFDRGGRLVFRQPRVSLTEAQQEQWLQRDAALRAAMAGRPGTGVVLSPTDGRRWIVARVPVAEFGWVVGASRLESEAIAPLRRTLLLIILLAVLVSILSVVLALLTGARVIRPLRRLRAHALALGRGQLDHRTGPVPVTELDELAAALNLMARQLQERRAEAERANARLEALFTESPVGMVLLDHELRYLNVNEAAARMIGRTREQVVGRPFREVVPELADVVEERFRQILLTGRPENNVEVAGRTPAEPDREHHWLSSHFPIPLPSGVGAGLGVITVDVTDLRRAEREARSLARFPRENPFPVLRIERDGTIVYANAASEPLLRHWGRQVGQVLPTAWAEFVRRPLADGEQLEVDVTCGETIFSLVFAPIIEDGYVNVYGRDVTGRRQAEAMLRASRERLDLVLTSAEVGTWSWDLETGRLDWDARCRQHFFVPAGEPVTIETFYERLHPDDRERTHQAIEQALRGGGDYDIDYRAVGPGGQERWVRALGRAYVDADGRPRRFDGVTIDATQRKLAEAQRERNLERLAALLAFWSDVLAEETVDGLLRRLVDAARSLTDACAGVAGHGYREGRFHSVASARAQDERCARGVRLGTEHAEACMERMQSGESIRLAGAECERQFGPLGEAGVPHGLLAARLVARGGHPSGVVAVTDHRAGGFSAEDEALLRQLAALASLALQHVAAREEATARSEDLARSNRDLEQFAYVASHDLQEPLRMVTGYLQLLQRRYQGRLDADADEFIGYAVDGAARMQNLIQDLLAFSRVGTRGKAFEPTDLNAVMRRALANLARVIEESDALVAQDEMPTVCADPTQMVQLFQNLIANAIKFRHPRRRPEVHVGCRREEDCWTLWVRDNGIGLEPQYAERVFVIFQRLHGRDEYPGTGIGLAICKKIAERHGGRIWVESTAGEGATFYVTLPDRGHAA